MNFHIMTLFPEMVMNGLNESITGRAIKNGLINVEAVNIRDFSGNKYGQIDDYIYGGGSGMLIKPDPVYRAYESIKHSISGKKRARVVYMTPQGKTFNQSMASEFSREDDLIFLCGHYEGIDERVLELIVTDNVSIGDFVVTGGELPAMMMIDAISRLVPGVLGSDDSAVFESFYNGLLEYPQYTRPEVFMDMRVPEVLLSGHHKKIAEWRNNKAIERTKERRPDMYENYISNKKNQ